MARVGNPTNNLVHRGSRDHVMNVNLAKSVRHTLVNAFNTHGNCAPEQLGTKLPAGSMDMPGAVFRHAQSLRHRGQFAEVRKMHFNKHGQEGAGGEPVWVVLGKTPHIADMDDSLTVYRAGDRARGEKVMDGFITEQGKLVFD